MQKGWNVDLTKWWKCEEPDEVLFISCRDSSPLPLATAFYFSLRRNLIFDKPEISEFLINLVMWTMITSAQMHTKLQNTTQTDVLDVSTKIYTLSVPLVCLP